VAGACAIGSVTVNRDPLPKPSLAAGDAAAMHINEVLYDRQPDTEA
jgi:hypothetical protein